MVILIAGGTHTGKTSFAQRLLAEYNIPYLSIDHVKMGLMRSGYCSLTPGSPHSELTQYLWPVISEIAKTAIENEQNLIIEGCYIPFDYKDSLDAHYLQHIKYICLIFSEKYIREYYSSIVQYSNQIEKRVNDSYLSKHALLEENRANLRECQLRGLEYVLIDDKYEIKWSPFA